MSWGRPPLVPRPDPEVRERRVAVALFVATCASVAVVSAWRWGGGALAGAIDAGWRALAFSAALMTTLLSHELGHFAAARAHRFRVGLPWFLPAPMLLGTFGAVIRLKDLPPRRSALIEMGAAGPFAGFAVVVGLACLWLATAQPVEGELTLARPLLLWALAPLFGWAAPPVPTDGDPLGFAVGVGCLLTGMNLLPYGQLDGGHVLAGAAPRQVPVARWLVRGLLVALGWWWPGWWAWLVVLWGLGAADALEVRRAERELTPRARGVAIAAAIVWALTFTPVPFG